MYFVLVAASLTYTTLWHKLNSNSISRYVYILETYTTFIPSTFENGWS